MSNYTNGWPNLPGAQRDVEEVKTILETQAFTDFINQYGQKPDNRTSWLIRELCYGFCRGQLRWLQRPLNAFAIHLICRF
jgi:hypothetical protein